MRTRNSSSIGPDDMTLENQTTQRNDDSQPQQQPLLSQPRPPPPAAAAPVTRTQQPGRRPPPPVPPAQQRQPPPPSSSSNRPSEVPLHRRPQPPESLNVITSPQSSPTRTVEHQQQQQRPPPVLSPSQHTEQQQQRQQHHHSPSERFRTTVTVPPPPPPPHNITTNTTTTNAEIVTHHPNRLPPEIIMPALVESIHWILQVRLPINAITKNTNDDMMMIPQPPLPIRKVQMTSYSNSNKNMDAITLSNCLQQCLNYTTTTNTTIAGLFCETTHTFYSLQHILSWDHTMIEERKHFVYVVELPPPIISVVPKPFESPEEGLLFWRGWYHYMMEEITILFHTILSNLYILLPIIFAILFYYQYNIVSDSIVLTYTTIYSTMIEQPLRDIYQYGPWFIGWEGDDISTICARITYHGDAQFWIRNMNECQRIYSAKEQAFIRIVLPFIYIIGTVLFVYTIRYLIQEYQNYQFQLHNNHRNPLERDMADLYNSFHVILRQIVQVHNNQQQRPPTLQQKHRPK